MSDIKKQILTLLKQRHHSHKVALEQEKDPRSKHAIDLIARIREDSRLMELIDSLPEDDIPKIEGWIARNKDESLVFCYHKPNRENSITQEWWGSCDADFRI